MCKLDVSYFKPKRIIHIYFTSGFGITIALHVQLSQLEQKPKSITTLNKHYSFEASVFAVGTSKMSLNRVWVSTIHQLSTGNTSSTWIKS